MRADRTVPWRLPQGVTRPAPLSPAAAALAREPVVIHLGSAPPERIFAAARPQAVNARPFAWIRLPAMLCPLLALVPLLRLLGGLRQWGSRKLHAVPALEPSHIRRRDPAVQFVSAILRALLWASPLSWFFDRRFLTATSIPRELSRWGFLAILGLGAPLACLTAAAVVQSAPQPQPPAGEPAAFEVASIKPVDPNVPHMVGVRVYPGGRVIISSFPLKTLIATAFGLSSWQISGGEEWTARDDYNVEAKPADAVGVSVKDLRYTNFRIEDKRLREMLQALLIDRFQLKFHSETKTGDVYLLQQSGKALRLRPAETRPSGADASADRGTFGSIGYVGGKWSIFATSMPQLARFASDSILHLPVLDRTALSGSFDYKQREPDLEPKYGGDQLDSFLSYLAELGLKLERAKGPVENFVIDHAAKPSPN
jgi:uncharacterized protein (TIGR03435 family)